MKIVYLAEWDFSIESGVKHKIIEQVSTWRHLGHRVDLAVLTPNSVSNSPGENDHYFTNPFLQRLPQSPFKNYFNKIMTIPLVIESISEMAPDIVYYRSGLYHPGLSKLFKKFPVITEVNSNAIGEFRKSNYLKFLIEKWGTHQLLKSSLAICPVSHEINNQLKPQLSKVIGNGIVFDKGPLVRKSKESRPQVIFVGSDDQVWHGTDKVQILAQLMPEVDFHIVGPRLDSSLKNIIIHGPLFNTELENLAETMDVGLGSLALFRNSMNEASPLKTRLYAKWGLPIMYAYIDTDLPSEKDFILQIPNAENAVETSLPKVREFVFRHHGADYNSERFRPFLDRVEKEKLRLSFFREVLNKSQGRSRI
jgi:hypothetical protein